MGNCKSTGQTTESNAGKEPERLSSNPSRASSSRVSVKEEKKIIDAFFPPIPEDESVDESDIEELTKAPVEPRKTDQTKSDPEPMRSNMPAYDSAPKKPGHRSTSNSFYDDDGYDVSVAPSLDQDVRTVAADQFEDNYEQGPQLGYGAFATVFVGNHRASGKDYAIKMIDRSKMFWGDRDALEDEIANLKLVREGPNIVQLYEVYEERDICYLVMELLQGGELFDRIIQKRTFTENEARESVRCMLRALNYMHDRRVAHRDLKPENLLLMSLESDTQIKLADFGFAKLVKHHNGCRTLCGTPGYLAPEILERWPAYDVKCDLWSVGVILFLLLGGYLPFEDENEDKVFDRTRNGKYDFHPKYWRHVSPEAKKLVSRMLTINPNKRIDAKSSLENEWIMHKPDHDHNLDLDKIQDTVKRAKRKMKAAVNMLIASERLQRTDDQDRMKQLHDQFHGYLDRQHDNANKDKLSILTGTSSRHVLEPVIEDSLTGRPCDDFYDFGEVLGEGGYAIVYKGTHKRTKKEFAIKDVIMKKVDDLQTLKDEIAALKLLRGGPHIVRLFDVFEGPDHTFMVMEEMKGGELLSRIVEKEVYTEREARQVCRILFQAIDYCHKKKIAHRDLKPENLLLVEKDDDTSIKIADFGFAKRVLTPNCLKTLCGTAAYVAPEVLDLKTTGYDHRADMWSVGVVTYILLGGYAPFEGPIDELAQAIVRGDYAFHDKYWSDISEAAKDLISCMLQVDPEVRYSAEEALQSEWMGLEDENLNVKDLSSAQGLFSHYAGESEVKAVVATGKGTSIDQTFTQALGTEQEVLDRQNRRTSIVKPLMNIDEGGYYGDEQMNLDSSSGQPFEVIYEVGLELGRGTFSVVVEAQHKFSKQVFAVKQVARKDLHPGDAVALQDEISALRNLVECEHIVDFHDVFDEPDYTFLVLECMRGGDLIDRIIDKRHYSENEAREVTRKLLLGIEYCHERKIANRNLKPENILLTHPGSDTDVKICDFGFAKRVVYPNSLRTQCGTEGYVAPEIIEHRPAYDVHCDMWSLGVVIYIVLGGYRPFRGEGEEVMRKIRYGEYKFHKRFWGKVSEEAKHLISRMLTVDPENRISATDALQSAWVSFDDF